MFTGIVQNRGKVVKRQQDNGQIHFSIGFMSGRKIQPSIKLGESIAVDGVCLTVSKVARKGFEVDVIRETVNATTLGNLRIGNQVNLERSLKLGDPIGGHFMTGHIDCRGRIRKVERSGRNYSLQVEVPADIMRFLAVKGSVAVDGISLTIQAVKGTCFKVAIIPHTLKETSLGEKQAGDFVNVEADLLARYLKLLSNVPELFRKSSGSITPKNLKEQGF